MEFTVLGKTKRKVSRLGFGGAPAGLKNYLETFDPARAEDREPVIAAIGRAFELGVNYFDTAPGYGSGASERIFGEALAPLPREQLFIATKVGTWGSASVRASLEESLRNLRCGYVDLLQIHGTAYSREDADKVLGKGGMLEQMERLRDEGLVRHIGFTVESLNESCHAMLSTGRFDVVQTLYNLIFQHACDFGWKSGLLYDAEALQMGIVTMRTTTSRIFQRWIQMVNPANAFDYTSSLIQFVLSNPMVDVALVGMRNVAEVEANAGIVDNSAGRQDLVEVFRRYV